jgi:hypothetical protein
MKVSGIFIVKNQQLQIGMPESLKDGLHLLTFEFHCLLYQVKRLGLELEKELKKKRKNTTYQVLFQLKLQLELEFL